MFSDMRSNRYHRPPMTDFQVLDHPVFMRLLRALRDGRVTRGESSGLQAPYLLHGEHVRLDMMILRKQGLIWMPLGGPPRLGPRGARLLDIDGRG